MSGREPIVATASPRRSGRVGTWRGRSFGLLLIFAVVLVILATAGGRLSWTWSEWVVASALLALFLGALVVTALADLRARRGLLGARLDELDRWDGQAFEGWVAERLRRDGFTVSRTKKTGDYGIDLIAEGAGRRVGVEVKRHDRPIGNAVVRSVVSGCQYHDCTIACVVTQSRFTRGAERQAGGAAMPVLLMAREDLPDLGARLWRALRA